VTRLLAIVASGSSLDSGDGDGGGRRAFPTASFFIKNRYADIRERGLNGTGEERLHSDFE
jgi:hypothetical protein